MKNVFTISFIIIIKFLFSFECDRTTPILKGGFCQAITCSEEQFLNENCKIDNEIIRTQWLTNIIWIGEENSRFINFANYNDDMVIEVSSEPANSKRIFYGLKSDGSYFFTETEDHQLIMNVQNQEGNEDNSRYYAENFYVRLTENEYLVSVANEDQYFEAYNFKANLIYQDKATTVLQKPINSLIHSSINDISNQGQVIFNSWMYNGTHNFYNMQKINFNVWPFK